MGYSARGQFYKGDRTRLVRARSTTLLPRSWRSAANDHWHNTAQSRDAALLSRARAGLLACGSRSSLSGDNGGGGGVGGPGGLEGDAGSAGAPPQARPSPPSSLAAASPATLSAPP